MGFFSREGLLVCTLWVPLPAPRSIVVFRGGPSYGCCVERVEAALIISQVFLYLGSWPKPAIFWLAVHVSVSTVNGPISMW